LPHLADWSDALPSAALADSSTTPGEAILARRADDCPAHSHQGERRHKLMSPKALKRRTFFARTEPVLIEIVARTWLVISGNQAGHPTIGGFPHHIHPGHGGRNSGEMTHHNTDLTRACCGLGLGLDNGPRHSPDAARARALERLSAASVGYRRLSGAVV
jgi:hypothetical protein